MSRNPIGYLAPFAAMLTGISCSPKPTVVISTGGLSYHLRYEPVTLRRTFTLGETEKYVSEMKMTESDPAAGAKSSADHAEVTITSTLEHRLTKISADHKSAEFSIKQSNFKYDSKPEMPKKTSAVLSNDMNQDMNSTATIDEHNMIKQTFDKKSLEKNPMAAIGMMFMQGSLSKPMPDGVELPSGAVKPGDSWKTPFPMIEMLGASADIKNTYLGETKEGGKDVYHIRLESHFPLGSPPRRPQSHAVPFAGLLSGLKGRMDCTGDVFLDKTNCAVVASTTRMKTHMVMDEPMGDPNTPMVIDQDMSISLKQIN